MADHPNEVQVFTLDPIDPDSTVVIRFEGATSDSAKIDSSRTNIYLTHAIAGLIPAMVNGAWQGGFNGTVTPNGLGYDYAITAHPDLDAGLWGVVVYVWTLQGRSLLDGWTFTVIDVAKADSGRATGRRTVDVVFEKAVRVRNVAVRLLDPVDRWTPVDWVGHGGDSFDAANPANYALSRPAGGNLSAPGVAVDPTVIKAEEVDGYWTDASEGMGVTGRYSTRVRLTVDFQWTALADYRLTMSNIVGSIGAPGISPPDNTVDFTGYKVSHKVRNTYLLFKRTPPLAQRDDDEGTGDLRGFLEACQEVFNRVLEDIDVFPDECIEIDRVRSEFLDALLYDLGNPFADMFPGMTDIQKRKLADNLVNMYRQKGTCQGIVNAVQFFVGVTLLGCERAWNEDVWVLGDGVYPAPYGGDLLAEGTYLGPGTGAEVRTFWLLHAAPGTITTDEQAKIEAVTEYMMPAEAHFAGIKAP